MTESKAARAAREVKAHAHAEADTTVALLSDAEAARAEKEAAKEHAAAEGLRTRDYERGYHTIKYHGYTMYQLNDDQTAQFQNERDAIERVAAMRVAQNLAV